jgi:enoyl-CoA hydratase/carnithine racemase
VCVLTLRALRAARGGTLEQALEREYALLRACLRWPDFREGVRAKLIDRDGAPRLASADARRRHR